MPRKICFQLIKVREEVRKSKQNKNLQIGLETFNERLLASYKSVSDKTQKGGQKKKRGQKMYITLIILIPLVSKNWVT